jgi:hypothetical protein
MCSGVEYVLSLCEALGVIPSSTHAERQRDRERENERE